MSIAARLDKLNELREDIITKLNALGFSVAENATYNVIADTLQSISKKTSTDLGASGAKVTVPAGYYAVQAEKSISSGSAKGPTSVSGTSATASHSGTTLTFTKSISITPTVSAGYVSSGTAQTTTVTLSATDSNFTAANIKSGVSIFGITGTYSGSSVTLSGDAVEANVRNGKTFYSNSTTKKTGSMPDSDITTGGYVVFDDTYSDGIDVTAGYLEANSIKGFKVPQRGTLYVEDMDQESTLYIFSGDGDVYVGERGDDNSDCVLIASAGTVRKTNMTLDQYASGTCVDTLTPGTSKTLVKVGTGFIEQQYIQVNGDTNLIASNIKKDVSIFGITGTYAGVSGLGTLIDSISGTYNKSTYAYMSCGIVSNSTTTGSVYTTFVSGYASTSYYNRVSTCTRVAKGNSPTYTSTALARFPQTSAANATSYPTCIMVFNRVLPGDTIYFRPMSSTGTNSTYGTETSIFIPADLTPTKKMYSTYLTIIVVFSFTTYTMASIKAYVL